MEYEFIVDHMQCNIIYHGIEKTRSRLHQHSIANIKRLSIMYIYIYSAT